MKFERRHRLTALAVAGLLAAVAIGVFLVQRRGAPSYADPGRSADGLPSLAESVAERVSVADVGVDGAVAAVHSGMLAAAERGSTGVPGDPEQLATAVEGTLRGYLGETFDPWVEFMLAHGIEPPDNMLNNPEYADKMWSTWSKFASSAAFDPADISIRRRPSQPTLTEGRSVATAVRPGSRPAIDPIPEASRKSIEVVIPAKFRDLNGAEFTASLGLEYTLSPEGDWVLMRATMYDVPTGLVVPGLQV